MNKYDYQEENSCENKENSKFIMVCGLLSMVIGLIGMALVVWYAKLQISNKTEEFSIFRGFISIPCLFFYIGLFFAIFKDNVFRSNVSGSKIIQLRNIIVLIIIAFLIYVSDSKYISYVESKGYDCHTIYSKHNDKFVLKFLKR